MSIDLSDFDFVDFGCSTGGSIEFAKRRFQGGAALGIDIAPEKVEASRAKGITAAVADATDPSQFQGRVRFTVLSHFLEHLPDFLTMARAVSTAIRISRSFVFIRQPWFDSDGMLASQGLKFYWSDWSGHPMPITSLQMYRAIRPHIDSGRIVRASVIGFRPVVTTRHPAVVPITAPTNSGAYTEDIHGSKPDSTLVLPAYQELVAILAISNDGLVDEISAQFKPSDVIFDMRRPANFGDDQLRP